MTCYVSLKVVYYVIQALHDSGQIHSEDQKRRMAEIDIQTLVQKNVNLSYEMRNNLLRGQLDNFGLLA